MIGKGAFAPGNSRMYVVPSDATDRSAVLPLIDSGTATGASVLERKRRTRWFASLRTETVPDASTSKADPPIGVASGPSSKPACRGPLPQEAVTTRALGPSIEPEE